MQRFRAASTEGRYFRSGPGGISICIPDDYASSTFFYSLKVLKFDLPWEQVKNWYPYVQTMNGIPTERSIVFHTFKGEKFGIKTYHFAEKQKEIAENIARSKSIEPEEALAASIEQRQAEQQFKVPSSAGELALEIKKKRDLLKEIDLRTVVEGERAPYVERVADMLEAKMKSLCPRTAGFSCSRKRYRPFNEWRDIFGIRVVVRKGLLDGYEIQVEPNDSESRQVTISMCPSSRISDLQKYISVVIGAVFFVMYFDWLLETVVYSLGELNQLTPLVMIAILVAFVGIAMGVLQLPVMLLRLLLSNKQHQEAQKQGIKVSIEEMTI
jgi:hypothetical protein